MGWHFSLRTRKYDLEQCPEKHQHDNPEHHDLLIVISIRFCMNFTYRAGDGAA